jgi:hypothetical protein
MGGRVTGGARLRGSSSEIHINSFSKRESSDADLLKRDYRLISLVVKIAYKVFKSIVVNEVVREWKRRW